jgi:hypothetical protein
MDADRDPRTTPASRVLDEALRLGPCSASQTLLLTLDPSSLTPRDAVAFAEAAERITAWWASMTFDALVAATGRDRRIDEFLVTDSRDDGDHLIRIEDSAREEVSAALRWSPSTAQHRMDVARLLAGPLAATRQALRGGRISTGHVAVIAEAAMRLPGRWADNGSERDAFWSACARLEARVLPVACGSTLSRTRSAARRAVLVIDPEGERDRRRRARCTRDVFLVDEVDGISTLIARLGTVDAHAVMAAVNEAAAHRATATAGERRAGALRDLILRRGAQGATSGVIDVRLDVVVDLPTLLGLADEPVLLQGDDVLPAGELRRLLADPAAEVSLRRLVTDPVTGHLLDRGRSTYAVPDRLRGFIVRRDGTCRFPGCARRASRCQIDHAIAWVDGGPTDVANLGALCTRHHQLKTHGGWRITASHADGSCTWRSPMGRTYHREPEPVLSGAGPPGVA